tara:strand:+ start:9395 stop:10036 length:642 start_codon:yes stop_codon:yes gene_type:complete
MKNVIPIFSTPMYMSEDSYHLSEHEIDTIKQLSGEALPNKNKNYSTSTLKNSYLLDNYQVFSNLRKFIESNIENYTTKVMMMPEEKVGLTQSWLNYNTKESGHHHHKHRNSIFSGIYYAKGTLESPTVFTRGSYFFDNWQVEYSERNLFNAEEFTLALEPGKLVIFPSSLYHYVPENVTDMTRVTIAFNTFWNTNIGSDESLTKLNFGNNKNA